jgi:uncharacterized membrane protein YedE/YeeE
MRLIIVFLSGLLFGTGLIVSGMINPSKVIGFLDIFGNWDPSLAFVMAGAVAVSFVGFRFVLKQERPRFATKFSLPTRTDIDAPLVIGPVLFGLGWGLVGLCPGPALVALTATPKTTWVFFVSMLVGMYALKIYRQRTLALRDY